MISYIHLSSEVHIPHHANSFFLVFHSTNRHRSFFHLFYNSISKEVDYILFYKLPPGMDLPLNPCPDEVEEYKYVSIEELKEMMNDPTLLWSPWFLGIMERGGFDWWQDLEVSLEGGNTNSDVVFFDPLPQHMANYNQPTHGRQTGVLSSTGVVQQ